CRGTTSQRRRQSSLDRPAERLGAERNAGSNGRRDRVHTRLRQARPAALPSGRRSLPRRSVFTTEPRSRRPVRARPASLRFRQRWRHSSRLGACGRLHERHAEGGAGPRQYLSCGGGNLRRMKWIRPLLAAWTVLVMIFFYLPIAILVGFSFN